MYKLMLITAQTIYYHIAAANDDVDIIVAGWEY